LPNVVWIADTKQPQGSLRDIDTPPRALMSARVRAATVTEITTGLGFVELGRFLIEYRKMFGSLPETQPSDIPRRRRRQPRLE
jgi:hypothetical protein